MFRRCPRRARMSLPIGIAVSSGVGGRGRRLVCCAGSVAPVRSASPAAAGGLNGAPRLGRVESACAAQVPCRDAIGKETSDNEYGNYTVRNGLAKPRQEFVPPLLSLRYILPAAREGRQTAAGPRPPC